MTRVSSRGKRTPYMLFKEAAGLYFINFYNQNFEGMVISLLDANSSTREIKITFRDSRTISRVMNETYRNKLTGEYIEARKSQDFSEPAIMYQVRNSQFMADLREESGELTDILGFKHYFVEDDEWTIDVASPSHPLIELFEDKILIRTTDCV